MRDTFSHSPLPRYAQLADLLRQRISRGVWKEGDLLPSLDALVAEFGVARVTVRQAIERLARHLRHRPGGPRPLAAPGNQPA